MRKIYFIFFFLVCLISGNLVAQSKDIKGDAAYYFESKDYKAAYDLYDQLFTKSPTNLEYQFRLGYCSLNYPEKKLRSIELFQELKKVDNSQDIDYYLAKHPSVKPLLLQHFETWYPLLFTDGAYIDTQTGGLQMSDMIRQRLRIH